MNIYFSGISGTGIGPLAEMAKDAGYVVFGSDAREGLIAPELREKGIDIEIGSQDGTFLRQKADIPGVDWFVYTSALPSDHPELLAARELGIKTTKRDDFIAQLIKQKKLKLLAVAGTHGKTTTTSMIIWACQQLNLPASHLVGSTLSWDRSGKFTDESPYFIYEADEYDRNFLKFHPWLSIITSESYDHTDIYKTPKEYHDAFNQFRKQSQHVVSIPDKPIKLDFTLAGELRRYDAALAFLAVSAIVHDSGFVIEAEAIVAALNAFPGVSRRFERLAPNVYTDYAHHPEEISATVKMAREIADKEQLKGVVTIYQPHQNSRQWQVKDDYKNAFLAADQVFWLPTYLVREDPNLAVLRPQDFIADLKNPQIAVPADANEALAKQLLELQKLGYLILLMTAGPADSWFRSLPFQDMV